MTAGPSLGSAVVAAGAYGSVFKGQIWNECGHSGSQEAWQNYALPSKIRSFCARLMLLVEFIMPTSFICTGTALPVVATGGWCTSMYVRNNSLDKSSDQPWRSQTSVAGKQETSCQNRHRNSERIGLFTRGCPQPANHPLRCQTRESSPEFHDVC